jgi:hypothetical protein
MAISPPNFFSQLSVPHQANNFIAFQSALLSPGTASASVTFTNIPSGNRLTYKICNTGSKTAYISGGNSINSPPTAVAISATPTPTSGANSVSTCDPIPAGSILTQDYIAGTDTLAAICASGNSTTLEISIGTGQ